MEPIALQAVYKSHRTTADGGFSLTLELAENMADMINNVYRMRDEQLFVVVMTQQQFNASQRVKQR